MEEGLTIESEKAAGLATTLAALRGESVEVVKSQFEDLMDRLKFEVAAVGADMAWVACRANQGCGKGRHPARLNFRDCFFYALAKQTGEPLLFKGKDFSQTDIVSALP